MKKLEMVVAGALVMGVLSLLLTLAWDMVVPQVGGKPIDLVGGLGLLLFILIPLALAYALFKETT